MLNDNDYSGDQIRLALAIFRDKKKAAGKMVLVATLPSNRVEAWSGVGEGMRYAGLKIENDTSPPPSPTSDPTWVTEKCGDPQTQGKPKASLDSGSKSAFLTGAGGGHGRGLGHGRGGGKE